MSLSEQNFLRLKEEFYFKTSATKASKILRRKGDDPKYMRRLLRHHEEKAITDKEARQRGCFDCLLGYYSMLELAFLVQFVVSIPTKDSQEAKADLSLPALRVYYREHYRRDLPQLLVERLEYGHKVSVSPSKGNVLSIFLQYAPLAYLAESDEDIECFLGLLRGGRRGGCDYRDTLKALRSHKGLVKSIVKDPSQMTLLDRSVEGFGKFLNLCVQLDAILQTASQWPEFQKEAFENHSYLFEQLRGRPKEQVLRALDNYVETTENFPPEENYFDRAKTSLERLVSRQYAPDGGYVPDR